MLVAANIMVFWSDERRMRLRSENGDIEEAIFDPIRMQDFGYSIEMAPGSMAGVDRDSLNQFYSNLLDKGHITVAQFLAVADFPKKDILRDMINQDQQVQGQIQQMQNQIILFKAVINPEMLTPEEKQAFEQIKAQELQNQFNQQALQSSNQVVQGQPVPGAVGQL